MDLQNEFPEVKGFSARNLWNMKKQLPTSEQIQRRIELAEEEYKLKIEIIMGKYYNINKEDQRHEKRD